MLRRIFTFAVLTFAISVFPQSTLFSQEQAEITADDSKNVASETETPGDTDEAVDEVNLAEKQDEIAQKYKRLEELLFRMAEFEAQNNPRRAAVLREAFKQSKDRLTVAQMQAVVRALQRDLLKQAVDGQQQTKNNLESLLELLLTEDRETNVAGEKERIRQYIRDIEKALRTQRTLQGQNEGGGDTDRIAKQQGDLAEKTGDLADRIKANEEGGAEAANNPTDGEPNDGEGSEGSEGSEGESGNKGEG
ncbi:MAG TPA: hypothetical protein DHW38_15735, partial [Planctomycetaceae bacterium]|nr:hypothetical protein [Planctomycetaceae bacterium]HCP84959.1 hypothetical protein [Planctomycetaceae bacterium]